MKSECSVVLIISRYYSYLQRTIVPFFYSRIQIPLLESFQDWHLGIFFSGTQKLYQQSVFPPHLLCCTAAIEWNGGLELTVTVF